MSVFFRRRGEPPAIITMIAVTITGSGDEDYCYATINGAKRYSAGTHEVYAGGTITFGIFGRSSSAYGSLTIDGTEVLRVTDKTTQTYDWIVPNGISTVEIAMAYEDRNKSTITVTTA